VEAPRGRPGSEPAETLLRDAARRAGEHTRRSGPSDDAEGKAGSVGVGERRARRAWRASASVRGGARHLSRVRNARVKTPKAKATTRSTWQQSHGLDRPGHRVR
jgi:hypothetical protein